MTGDKEELPDGRPSEEEADAITRETSVGRGLGAGGNLGLHCEGGGRSPPGGRIHGCLPRHPDSGGGGQVRGAWWGVIPMRLLLDELFLHVAPEEFLVDLRAMEGIEEFGKLSRARSAKDLMQPAVYVTMDDSVREAFSRMHEHRLEGLPIVDKDMRVVGCLSRLQLIRLWLQKHQEWAERGKGHRLLRGQEAGV